MADDGKAEWIRRVLGVAVGADPAPANKPFDEPGFRRDFRVAVQTWRDASEQVDGQLNELRKVLLATGDADLQRIAEFGLNGITGTRKVGLQKALVELGSASGPALAATAKKAVQAATDFQGFVQSDPRIKACDSYPKISVPIGPTLGRALGALAQALTI